MCVAPETKKKRNALPLFRLQPSILFRPSRMLGQDLERHLLHPGKSSCVCTSSERPSTRVFAEAPAARVTPEEHRGIRTPLNRTKYSPRTPARTLAADPSPPRSRTAGNSCAKRALQLTVAHDHRSVRTATSRRREFLRPTSSEVFRLGYATTNPVSVGFDAFIQRHALIQQLIQPADGQKIRSLEVIHRSWEVGELRPSSAHSGGRTPWGWARRR